LNNVKKGRRIEELVDTQIFNFNPLDPPLNVHNQIIYQLLSTCTSIAKNDKSKPKKYNFLSFTQMNEAKIST